LKGTGQGAGVATPLAEGRGLPPHEEAAALALAWEQKPVAVLAIELTWPAAVEGEVPRYEPWTVVTRWAQLIVEKVQGLGGVILQHAPSLLLAGFGLPHTLEQLPQRAVQATLALRQLTAEPEVSVTGEPHPAMRQAVHWGQVLVDSRANDLTSRLLPVGETLALPVRLLGHAAVGEILVSSEVGRLVEAWCELQTCEGLLGAEAYAVVGLRPQRTLLRMHGSHPLSRFVGRAHELATLQTLGLQVEQGRGQVVGLVGEPGVGKSRLCYEFMRVHHSQGWQICETSADSYGQATAYLPVIDLLKAYFHIAERDDVPTMRAKVSGKLLTLDKALGPTLPAFLTLLDVPVEDPAWQSLDPPQRRQRTLEAIKWLLLEESRVQPLLLVVENLHWIDTETQVVLESLIESLPAARLFLLVTYRPEYQHAWGSKTYYTQLRLDPLSPEHAHELLTALLGADASLEPLAQRLVEHTEGNPLFLEESVRMLVETQGLVGERGAYYLAKPLFSLQVPVTVQAILAARMDQLSVEAKHLLQAAAVIGRDVPLSLLQAIAEQPEEEVRHGLLRLQAAEFLYETRLFPEIEYTFKHALTQQVAYGNLPHERRRLLHARIVQALETLYAERRGEHIELLADHAFRGEVWEQALAYCRQASAKASARSASREAVTHLEQALAALQHLPESRDTRMQAIDLRLELRNALHPLGELGRIHDCLHEATCMAEALGDPHRLSQVSALLGHYSWGMGDQEHAIECLQHALAIARDLGDVLLQLGPNFILGEVHQALGNYRQAIQFLQQVSTSLTGDLAYERFGWTMVPSVCSRQRLVYCLAELGEFVEGTTLADEGVKIAEAVNHPFTLEQMYHSVGYLALLKGDFDRAIPVLERALGLCRAANIQSSVPGIASALGHAYALAGRVDEALPLLEQAVERATAMKRWAGFARGVARLSEGYLLAGRRDAAVPLAQRALELSHEYKERGNQAWALRLLGAIVARRDPPKIESAEASYHQALTLAEELEMRPLQAHIHRGLGILYTQIGQREQARDELSTAIALYRAMEMQFWMPQAEAVLVQVT
jgi:tetratricopeptide (TPR) repeat protein/class 3 adenylate cyclase